MTFETFPDSPLFVIRGDTSPLMFQRLNDAGQPIAELPDKMYFTVKKTTKSPNPIIQKTLDDMELGEDEYFHFTIEPEDTDGLPYGTYVFDLEVINGGAKQTIAEGSFTVGDEVTFRRNEV